jgi:5'-3' exonuclease
MKYLIIDTANTFFRARHSASRQADMWDKLGFAIHVTLSSVNKAWREHQADHVIFCLEGRSWRKDFYKPYKANRAAARAALTEQEAEEDRLFWQAFDDLKTFLIENSNCTVLQHSELEADDLISGWIRNHPNDEHIIISSDSDFHQLLAENVKQFNGVADELYTINGILDRRGKLVVDKKTKEPKQIPDPKWILFEKCVRGDPTDNVFSAYPGVRTKGTKNRIGLTEAYADMNKKGYNWNNLMLQRWTDHDGVEHRVLDDYERNRTLIDLTAQPDTIKEKIDECIQKNILAKSKFMVGAKFLKFCGKYELSKIAEMVTSYSEFLSAEYPKNEHQNT